MRAKAGPTFTPDAAKATDTTVDMSERKENARRLVRGEGVREVAKDALIHSADSRDGHDTGSQLPGDVARHARDAERLARHMRANDGRTAERGETDAETTTAEPAHDVGTTAGTEGADAPEIPRQPMTRDGPRIAWDAGRTPDTAGAPAGDARARFRIVTDAGRRSRPRESSESALTASSEPMPSSRRIPSERGVGALPADVTPRPAMAPSSEGRLRTAGDLRRRVDRQALQHAVATSRERGARAAMAARTTAGPTAAPAATAPAATTEGTIAAAPVIAVLVIILLLVALASILVGGAVDEDQARGAHRLAQTATDEYLLGEARGDYNHKGLAYSAYVRGQHGGKRNWDACLVGWCMGQTGFVDAGLTHAYGDVSSYINHFRLDPKLGEVHDWYGEQYRPVEGDLFVSWYADGTQHIGIVIGCDGTRFETVEGDVAGGPNNLYDLDEGDGLGGYVARRTRTLGEYSYTFIHPLYSEDAASKAQRQPQ